MHLSSLFIDNKFYGHLIHSHIKRLFAEWLERWTCNVEAMRCFWLESYRGQDFFCNVHLFRFPRKWTGSVQMKSSMTFIRGNRCIEREKDNFKSREVKRLKECALALKEEEVEFSVTNCWPMSPSNVTLDTARKSNWRRPGARTGRTVILLYYDLFYFLYALLLSKTNLHKNLLTFHILS